MKRYRLHIAFLTAAALVAGCSTTKRLGQDEVLYTGVRKITIEADSGVHMPSYVESAVKNPLSVKPNNPLYSPYIRTPLPVGLWAYNYLYTEKTKGFKHWLYERLAKDPVLVSSVQPELRVQMVSDILANYGYFGSRAEYETRYKKHGRKARLSYRVYAAPPWRYSRIAYPAVRGPLTALVDSLQSSSLLKTGAQYNIDTLAAERTRLSRILRNRGYYYFRPEYFEYQADTTRKRREVDLRLLLKPGIPAQATRSYRIGDITVNLQNIRPKSRDSMRVRDMRVYFDTPRKIRPKVLARNVNLRPGELFTVDAQERDPDQSEQARHFPVRQSERDSSRLASGRRQTGRDDRRGLRLSARGRAGGQRVVEVEQLSGARSLVQGQQQQFLSRRGGCSP